MELYEVELSKFSGVGFDAYLKEGRYTLQVVFAGHVEKDVACWGVLNTGVVCDSVAQIKKKISAIKKTGLFGNLVYIDEGHIVDESENVLETINWVK